MPKFTRQHYVAIAQDLREERPAPGDPARAAWEARVDRYAERFAADNPNFSRDRFKTAAGA